tara:strand:- start:619 stop:771 length:153 start_codon:yes stop_codon:yes gene_type:complete
MPAIGANANGDSNVTDPTLIAVDFTGSILEWFPGEACVWPSARREHAGGM